jgi:hypothetical protein
MDHRLEWWRDRVLKQHLKGCPRQRRIDDKTVWVWELPEVVPQRPEGGPTIYRPVAEDAGATEEQDGRDPSAPSDPSESEDP